MEAVSPYRFMVSIQEQNWHFSELFLFRNSHCDISSPHIEMSDRSRMGWLDDRLYLLV